MGIEPINPFELPLLNTIILLSSGATVTYAHHALIKGDRAGSLYGSIFTVGLAVIFTFFQGVCNCFVIVCVVRSLLFLSRAAHWAVVIEQFVDIIDA